MQIFLSYSSTRRDVALRLKLALEAEQHEVFFDRDDLAAGQAYHQAIREALGASDLFIYLVSPESVAPGSYTLTELALAQARWPRPAGHVLPVVVAATPKATIPAYLKAVTLLEPTGDLVAETMAAVARLARPPGPAPWKRLLVAAVVLLAVGGTAAWGWGRVQADRLAQAAAAERAAQAAEQSRRAADEAGRAARLCLDGSHTDGFGQLTTLAARADAPAAVHTALEDCAMAWLRVATVVKDAGITFSQLSAPLRVVLTRGLVAGAQGQRAADLRAHLGWADALLLYEPTSPSADPVPHYRQALQDDPGNVYAHAMWGLWLMLASRDAPDEALRHFDAALASGRDVPFVRRLQLGAFMQKSEHAPHALRVLDQMRQRQETLPEQRRSRVWSYVYHDVFNGPARARPLLDALPPEDGLKTFLWLFPQAGSDGYRRAQWRALHALLLTHAGRAAEARPDLLALQRELRAERASGSLMDTVDRLLAAP